MKYVVKRYWEVCDSVEVNAGSVDEAIDLAHELPVDNAKAEYVSGSMNTDPSEDVRVLTAERGTKHTETEGRH